MSVNPNVSAPAGAERAFAYVVISVPDVEQALGLWQRRFGMRVVARRTGTDPGLAKVWGLAPKDIVDQALLLTPGAAEGGIHLVQFKLPGAAVRANAAPTDLVPKSVDIVVRDIPTRFAELTAAGYQFRSKPGRFESDGVVVFETHMLGPDSVNIVLLEEVGRSDLTSAEGYGVAPQIVLTTADNLSEKVFLESVFGMSEASYHKFSGPEIEKTIGLPKGAALDIRILGDPKSRYGRLELVQYEGVKSANLYPRAVPPARGMLSATYFVGDLAPILARGAVYAIRDHGVVSTIYGASRMARVRSPAGFMLDVFEKPAVP
jgi:catechol 2,3-dioxygenase-like lactoylglutathione lyase family enzyme